MWGMVGGHFRRFRRTSFSSGTSLPPILRSFDESDRVSASMSVRTLVADALTPSRRTTAASNVQVLPSRDHDPSPKPPLVSKVHERTFFASGSQPIHVVPPPTSTFLNEVVKCDTTKFC